MRARYGVGLVVGVVVAWVVVAMLRPPPWETWRPEVVVLPSTNGYQAVAAACAMAVDRKPPPPLGALAGPPAGPSQMPPPPPDTTLAPATMVQRNREAVARLREALALPYEQPADERFRSLQNAERMNHVLLVEARWFDQSGQLREAMRCRLDAVELALKLPRGADDWIVSRAAAIEQIVRKDAAEMVPPLDGPTAAAAARRLERLAATRLDLPARARQNRRAHLVSLAEAMREVGYSHLFGSFGCLGDYQPDGRVLLAQALFGGGKRVMWAGAVRFYDDQVAAAEHHVDRRHWPRPSDCRPTVEWCVHNTGIDFETDSNETGTQLWLAALALRAYRAARGSYPASLADLVPDYLNAVPRDLYADAPLRYLLDGAAYRLYSLGPDGIDQSGTPPTIHGLRIETPAWNDSTRGDVVWGITPI